MQARRALSEQIQTRADERGSVMQEGQTGGQCGHATAGSSEPFAPSLAVSQLLRNACLVRFDVLFSVISEQVLMHAGKESILSGGSASTAGSALPFAASTAVSGLSAMPSLAPHEPPRPTAPASSAASGGFGASSIPEEDSAAAGTRPAQLPAPASAAAARTGEARLVKAPSTSLQKSAAGEVDPAQLPLPAASAPADTAGSKDASSSA